MAGVQAVFVSAQRKLRNRPRTALSQYLIVGIRLERHFLKAASSTTARPGWTLCPVYDLITSNLLTGLLRATSRSWLQILTTPV